MTIEEVTIVTVTSKSKSISKRAVNDIQLLNAGTTLPPESGCETTHSSIKAASTCCAEGHCGV